MRRFLFPAALLVTANPVFSAEQTAISPTAGLLQIFLGLVAVLALMAFAAWAFKRIGPVTSGNKVAVKIVGGVNVGNRERIMVVEVADQWIVVGITASQINTLSTMPKQANLVEQQDDAQPVNQFSTWLKRTMDKRNEPQQ
ncbi:MAG: flagellar biosynthetic protein FliO [Pseudomonadota bacterium]|jgi:flagellar protein FliO/FliZ